MALQTYQYSPLPSARSIRLFSLLSGADEEIKIKLDTFSIDEAPDYDTISLDWTRAGEKSPLTINDASASVPISLIPALLEFRKSMTMTALKFWTEAVCVNPADESERSVQTRIRPDILEKAKTVHIWIPEDDPDIAKSTVDCIEQGLVMLNSMLRDPDSYADETELQVDYLNKELTRAKDGRPYPLSHDWSPLVDIVNKPWFKRKLSIQESSWTSVAFLYCGTCMIQYDQLGLLLIQLHRSKQLCLNKQVIEDVTVGRARALYEYRVIRLDPAVEQPHAGFDHHHLFKRIMSHHFECEDLRDHLYSLVTMINGYDAHNELLRPDYSLTWQEALTKFAIWALRREPDLHSLSSASGPSEAGLPSWVCNLTKNETRGTLAVPEPIFRVGGTEKAEMDVSPDQKVLKLSARIVDSVQAIQPGWKERVVPDGAAESEPLFTGENDDSGIADEANVSFKSLGKRMRQQFGWFNSCVEMASQGPHASPQGPCGMTEQRFDAFWRTFCVEFIAVRPRGTDDAKARDTFLHYAAFARDKDSSSLWDIYRVEDGKLRPSPPNERRAGILETETAMQYVFAVSHFGTTVGDRLALVPRVAKPGDDICVIPGTQVPYVIRRLSSGRYQLVGECYLSDMMDDGATEKSDTPLQPIEIE